MYKVKNKRKVKIELCVHALKSSIFDPLHTSINIEGFLFLISKIRQIVNNKYQFCLLLLISSFYKQVQVGGDDCNAKVPIIVIDYRGKFIESYFGSSGIRADSNRIDKTF
jgi:hypothetical protein